MTVALVGACGQPKPAAPTEWSQQSSAASGGGLTELARAARLEGTVVVPAVDAEAVRYLPLITAFEARYGVRVATVPMASDADQIENASRLDVFDLGVDTAVAQTSAFAPYLVFYWQEIPTRLKNPRGYWSENCGSNMAVSYDAGSVPPIRSLSDLLNPSYVVLFLGDPRTSNSALAAVVMASLNSGGSADDVAPGIDFLRRLPPLGNRGDWNTFFAWDSASGQEALYVPDRTVTAYDVQAVNRLAAHPAAARLWEEFLFSDAGQNLCAANKAHPSRLTAMRSDGVLDVEAAAALPAIPPDAVMLTPEQMAKDRVDVSAGGS